jgi:hypothetical protein
VSDFHLEHIPVQEQERVERLRLCGGSDVASGRQMIHERRDALCAEFARMPLVMEQDVTTNPKSIRLFSTPAQVASAAENGHLVHEARGWRCNGQLTP